MSSNLTIYKTPFSTPQLKRTLNQHQAMRASSKITPKSLAHPRIQKNITHMLPIKSAISKVETLEQISTKGSSQLIKSDSSGQRYESSLEQVMEINEVFKQVISQDMQVAYKRKQGRGSSSSYEKKVNYGQVWVGQPVEIPRQVFEENNQNKQSTNCLQGFLSEIGVFYFAIENYVLFYDSRNICKNSKNICKIKMEQRSLNALYEIQIFTLGKPYFGSKKTVMIFLHPYSGEIYQFKVIEGLNENSKYTSKQLQMKSLLNFCLPQEKPNKLFQSKKGLLYYADNKGKVYHLDFSNFLWANGGELISKKINTTTMAFFKNTKKYITSSLKTFASSIKNYSLSFFSSKPKEANLLFDEEKQLMIVFMKEVRNVKNSLESKDNIFIQYFMVYSEKTNQLLHTFKDSDIDIRNEEIIHIMKLEPNTDNKYNFILLLKSGNRVFIEIDNFKVSKSPIIKKYRDMNSQDRSSKISAFFLEQCIMGHIICSNSNRCSLVLSKVEDLNQHITVLNLEMGEMVNIYYQQSQPSGYRKKSLVQYETSNNQRESTSNLPQLNRQIFYSHYQLYYATEFIIQKIKILRPIDIFYSLFLSFSDNFPSFFDTLKIMMPQLFPSTIISFCCQLLVDTEGIYIYSEQFENKINKKHRYSQSNSKYSQSSSQKEHKFKDISRESRAKLIQIMKDTAINAGNHQKQQKQRFIAQGILQYYARLFKTIFSANINSFTSELCRIISFILQELKNFFSKQLQVHLKSDKKSYFSKVLKWINTFHQLIILTRDIPTLPNITIEQALIEKPELFEQYIFQFLRKQCEEEVFNQMRELIPNYITPNFTRTYRFYCQISLIDESSQILQMCKNNTFPDYFIDYLVNVKNIPEAILLKEFRRQNTVEIKDVLTIFSQKVKQIYSKQTTLSQKEQIFVQLQLILSSERKKEKSVLNLAEQEESLQCLHGQIKLQKLIISIYHSKISNKSVWNKIISICVQSLKYYQQEIIYQLNTCLLDQNYLEDIVNSLDEPLLKVMYTYYFNPHQFQHIFFKLAQDIFIKYRHSINKLNEVYQEQLEFMICKAKLAFSFEEIMIILDAFINLLINCEELQNLLNIERGILQRKLYWPLCYCAEWGLDLDSLYTWGMNRLSQLEKSDPKYTYISLCCCYLVKDYLPRKKDELIQLLKCQQEHNFKLKQVYVLVFD